MAEIICYDSRGNPITRFYQWDKNQSITVSGLSTGPVPVFQFSNRNHQESITVSATVTASGLTAIVPNELLEEAETLQAYIYREVASGAGRTLGVISIPVRPRRKPSDYVEDAN